MKKTLTLLIIVAMCSCNKQLEVPASKIQTNANEGKLKPASAADGAWDLLGYGYNVTGEYGNSSAATYQIVNVSALKTAFPDRVEQDLSTLQEGSLNTAENALTYSSNLSANLTTTVGFKLFGGTIKASYSDANSFSSKYIYGSYNLKIRQKRVKFNSTNDILMQYLTPAFIADIQSQTPQYIVSHYGTHILSDIILGAKLEILYQSQTSNSDRKTAASAGVDVNVVKIFNISTGLNYSSSATSQNYSQSLHYKTHGGNPALSLVGTINLDNTAPTVNVSNWQSSSTVANAEMIDISTNGLIPIYDLISNATKKQAVKDYVTQYLTSQQVTLLPQPVYCYYAPNGQDHFLTLSSTLLAGNSTWNDLGSIFQAYNVQVSGSVPVYEFYNHVTDHAFSTNPNEATTNGWTNNGASFYAFTTQQPGTVPIYEWYKSSYTDHAYNSDRNAMVNYTGWNFQGIKFYAYPNSNN